MLLICDLGGTNARLQIWDSRALPMPRSPLHAANLRVSNYANMADLLADFCTRSAVHISSAVLAVCGPIMDGGRKNEQHNNPAWNVYTMASDLERRLGMAEGTITFLNDFEALGWAIAAHLDPNAMPACKVASPIVLHAAQPLASAAAACIGAGTGLGACYIVPHPTTRTEASGGGGCPAYLVLPSEAGMTDTLCPRTEEEWALLQWLRDKYGAYVEVGDVILRRAVRSSDAAHDERMPSLFASLVH